MFNLLKIFNEFKDYFVLVVLIIVSLSLISIDSKPNISGFRAVIIGTMGYIQNMFGWVPNIEALRSENKTLVELNIELSSEVSMMRQALQENNRFRAMLDLKETSQYKLIACDVVNKSSVQMRNFVTVNKGEADGIKVGMAVCSEAGLVGSVIGISNNFSMIELLNNRNVRIPAVLSGTQTEGILRWEGDEYLYLHNIPKAIEVKIGEVVTTSLHSNRYPHNLMIGKVERVVEDPGSHFSRIYVKPAATFFRFTQLFVVEHIQNTEEVELIRQFEERILMLENRSRRR